MKRVATSLLMPGMILADNVYSYNNEQLIAEKGSALTEKSIAKLEYYSIINVFIEDAPIENHFEQNSASKTPSYSQRLQQTAEFKRFKADYEKASEAFEKAINNCVYRNHPIKPEELTKPVFDLVASTDSPSGMFDMIHNLREFDSITYKHSMDVSLVCNIIGNWMRLSEEDIYILTQAGLLHDIGKLLIPKSIIDKPTKLTNEEFEIVKQHPQNGYNILKDLSIDSRIKNGALMHHERNDGSGYPLHLVASQIDQFAKIIAIADVYDAMINARTYREPICPFLAISVFEKDGLIKYDPNALLTFLSNIANTFIMNRVRLSDGREGDVVFINKDALSRPTVKIGDAYVDLSINPNLSVVAMI